MLVEIPDPGIIIGTIVAFFGGLLSLSAYKRLKPLLSKPQTNNDRAYEDKLQYYENLLIDMKIRLDSLEMMLENQQKVEEKSIPETRYGKVGEEKQYHAGPTRKDEKTKSQRIEQETEIPQEQEESHDITNLVDHVLKLVSDNPMMSRDIQKAIGRSREHTSRLMKKLYDEGLVKRGEGVKPYRYSISDAGRRKLEQAMAIA